MESSYDWKAKKKLERIVVKNVDMTGLIEKR